MAKVQLTDLTSLANDTSATNSINENFQTLEDYINDNVLSRDTGAETNTMQNDIDMNSYNILNVTNLNGSSVADITGGILTQVGYAEEWAQKAEDSLVSVAAGGNGTTEYSAFHYAQKAAASASSASTDSGLAATSASAAAAAQTAAELALDTFDDIFLGAKASPPTLDNDGDALATGALYFNTGNDTLYIWDGAAWNTAAFDTSGALLTTDLGVTVQAYDADTAKLDVEQTFTSAQTGSTQVNSSATGNVTLDFSTYNNFILTLTGNLTLDNPTTETVGQSGFIVFKQDGTGSRTLTLGSQYLNAGGTAPTLTTTASAIDIIGYCVAGDGQILLGSPLLAFS